jgi:hypothetical protein
MKKRSNVRNGHSGAASSVLCDGMAKFFSELARNSQGHAQQQALRNHRMMHSGYISGAKTMKKLLLALCFAAIASPASAGFVNGNKLLDWCKGRERSLCAGYVAGVVDMLDEDDRLCLTTDVNVTQITDITTKFLAAHPESRHQRAAILVYRALTEAFSCRKEKP